MKRSSLLLCAAVLALAPLSASAQEVRIARQFSMDVKIAWSTFNGPNAMNDALISDSIDVVAGGVPGLLTLWNRTKGTANEVRGISALSSQPFLLNTRADPQLVRHHGRPARVRWTMVPQNAMKFAAFMASVGSLKEAPKSWKDLFSPKSMT